MNFPSKVQADARRIGSWLGGSMLLAGAAMAGEATHSGAVDAATSTGSLRVGLDTVWVLFAAMLVFGMNAGFALLESGLCRSKNCVNIMAKNFSIFAVATVAFWITGWGLMFGGGSAWLGLDGVWFVGGGDNSPAVAAGYQGVYAALGWAGVPLWAKFFLQLALAGMAATILSGALAERVKFGAFLLFSFLLVAVLYPIAGHWVWGGGWLAALDFRDFAGSTVVHSVGGWAALAGVIILGPRYGKYREGKVHPIPGHNMNSAALGALFLWLGWLGLNAGATMGVGDGAAIAHIVVVTNLAGALGALGALTTAWLLLNKPDLTMILNGCLAGLVASSAACAFVSVPAGALIGGVAGVLVVFAVIVFDKLKLDDPVGALSVHLVNGIWGTLAVGLFYDGTVAAMAAGVTTPTTRWAQTLVQLQGILAIGAFALLGSFALWFIVKLSTRGLRVSPEEESEGLDISTHGNEAYPDFTAYK